MCANVVHRAKNKAHFTETSEWLSVQMHDMPRTPATVYVCSHQAERYLKLRVEGKKEGLSGAIEAVADFKGFWGQSTKHLPADRNAVC